MIWVLVVALAAAVVAATAAVSRRREVELRGSARLAAEQISALEATNEDLRRARDRAVESIEAFTDGVVLVDEHGKVVLRNTAALQYDGARRSDAVAEAALEEELWKARNGEPAARELQLFGPPRRVLSIRAVPLERDGRNVGAVAFVRDVTEARRVESVRRDFVANVTHELKTPIGALELLAETIASADDPAVVASLSDRMVDEAERLAQIVDDLLDLSLAEANEIVRRELVPIGSIVDEAIARLGGAAAARSIVLQVRDTEHSPLVECDRRLVLSAIANLVDNAMKYSEPGQPVTISVVTDRRRVGVQVADRGIGIPTRDLERIFERFYRVDRARSRDTGGTGLGLSIVRHVVQSHGGVVEVTSHEGEGSTFTLWFPAVETASRLTEAS